MMKKKCVMFLVAIATGCGSNSAEMMPMSPPLDAAVDGATVRPGTSQSVCGSMTSLTSAGVTRSIGPFSEELLRRVRSATGVLHFNSDTPTSVQQRRYGSAVMIAPRFALTAAHNLDPNIVLGTPVTGINSPSDMCRWTHFDLGFVQPNGTDPVPLVNGHEGQSYACVRVVSYAPGGLDVAVVQLSGTPGITWGYLPVATDTARIGRPVLLVGTPAGLALQASTGRLLGVENETLFYDADTVGGFSGSGIVDERGTVIGVHRAGNCTDADTDASRGNSNYGTSMSEVMNRDPTLRNLIAGERCGRSVIDCLCAAGGDTRAQSQCLANNLDCSQCVTESFQQCCGAQVSALQSCSRAAGCNDNACVSSRCGAESRALDACWSAAQQNQDACLSHFATCFGQYPISC